MQNIGLLILRVVFGVIMAAGHGWPKLIKLFSGNEIKFFDPFGIGAEASLVLAVFGEFFLSILLVFGIFTRFSSIGLLITMFVAGFIFHLDDPFSSKEKAILFLTGYVTLLFTGPGKYALQNWIDSKIKTENKVIRFLLS